LKPHPEERRLRRVSKDEAIELENALDFKKAAERPDLDTCAKLL
jgi:hypothetical protein